MLPRSSSTLTTRERTAVFIATSIGLAAAVRFLGWSSPSWYWLLITLNAPGFAIAAGPFALLGGMQEHNAEAAGVGILLILLGNPAAYGTLAYAVIRR